ncbi:MAG: type II toxin-antitoxin system VapC family toxin [Moraxellaceae bacterium]|nr:type II toxin-antitoxin system VapC family toxin [Pseudomonadales bacterium]MCB1673349.1 type II toxin-antitoxin system VapC family toxin [Pseudomonadales bacterium]MCP5174153.1 type II toxin-antitoxin system VapC family toxin [Moraxellaceae bacterium]MCP5178109.1 type II toxin-antitoxin system VapC family toxin [Moraxellaceae bacterium]HQV22524.1 type II toxin-antitoxin system VapC family toxin [Agitococcus sp.]
MKYLLDTHALLWFLSGDEALSKTARLCIENEANEIFVSMASLWEITIKSSLGKLKLATTLEEMFIDKLSDNDIQVLKIDTSHLIYVHTLPFYHRDPFDRLIASQSLVENMPLISKDLIMDDYGVQRIW